MLVNARRRASAILCVCVFNPYSTYWSKGNYKASSTVHLAANMTDVAHLRTAKK